MNNESKIIIYSITLDCREPLKLAEFYMTLLNWAIEVVDEEYVLVYNPEVKYGTYPSILLQKNTEYVQPVWPEKKGAQQQMAHIDFTVSNLEKAVKHAIACGATIAKDQYSDEWKVMFDPEGHPFCLCL